MSENTCPHGRFEPSACHECVNDLIGRARAQKATLAQRDEEMRVFSADMRRKSALWDSIGAPAVELLRDARPYLDGVIDRTYEPDELDTIGSLNIAIRALLDKAEKR